MQMNYLSLNESNALKIAVSALQFDPRPENLDGNLLLIENKSSEINSDIFVIPELASTGYFYLAKEELIDRAEAPGKGRFTSWMIETAVARSMVIVGGFAEREGGKLYNSALIALPDGSWRVYRKAHLFYKEKLVFEPGDSGFFIVEWNGVRLGTMICYDWRFPEAARTLALMGADIILHPSNLVAARELWGPTMLTRAFENRVAIVTANRIGTETRGEETLTFTGESQIVGHNGVILARAGAVETCVIEAGIAIEPARRKSINDFNDIFADRRPELYA
jgi:predicted amidohydrolase